MRKLMFAEPHFGQNFILPKTSSCSFNFIVDFLRLHFSFNMSPNSVKLNPFASSPHRGQCCPGSSLLSYVHLEFGQVHEGIATPPLDKPTTKDKTVAEFHSPNISPEIFAQYLFWQLGRSSKKAKGEGNSQKRALACCKIG